MPRANQERRVLMPSVLERLAGAASAGHGDLRVDIRHLRRSVAQNLEWLLNTRSTFTEQQLGGLECVASSHIAYGIPDLSRYSPTNAADAQAVADILGEAIRRFEPRLVPSSVRVTLVPGRDNELGPLQYRIDAILFVQPIDEPVAFDTKVMVSGQVDVQESG